MIYVQQGAGKQVLKKEENTVQWCFRKSYLAASGICFSTHDFSKIKQNRWHYLNLIYLK